MKWLVALLACVGLAQAQVTQHTISDDGYVRVPLQFPFPYYGRVFTESYMFSNGVVGFLNPTNTFCCSGFDITQPNHPFSFAIMPLQTDLINYSGRFLTEGTTQYQRYKWENISEYGRPNNLNTFGVEIKPSGYIAMNYEKVNISPNRTVTIGMTGDSSLNEHTLYYSGAGFSRVENVSYITQSTGNLCLTNPLSSPTCAGYQEAYTTQQCGLNALYSPSCVGYEVAYHDQQCSLSPLYASDCVGYTQAYHNQQCSLNPLYATTCQGYAQAYQTQQCNLNPLYNQQCSGYAEAYRLQQCGINPLYSTTCLGYEAAYFNQQCTANPLYNSGCTGYAEAYLTYQCTQNPLYSNRCSGYQEAYRLQQCGLNPLYSNTCNGYQAAYLAQQCNINQLYSTQCPNYRQAYFDEQCRLNGLYDRQCPNYATAYATQQVVQPPAVVVSAPVLQVSTTGTVAVETPVVSDPVVNEVITRQPAQSVVTTNATSNTTTNSVTSAVNQTAAAEPKQEKKTETKPVASAKRTDTKNEVSSSVPQIVEIKHEYKTPIILDLAYQKMVKKPITDNNRAMYHLLISSQRQHEEMIDEQYRR